MSRVLNRLLNCLLSYFAIVSDVLNCQPLSLSLSRNGVGLLSFCSHQLVDINYILNCICNGSLQVTSSFQKALSLQWSVCLLVQWLIRVLIHIVQVFKKHNSEKWAALNRANLLFWFSLQDQQPVNKLKKKKTRREREGGLNGFSAVNLSIVGISSSLVSTLCWQKWLLLCQLQWLRSRLLLKGLLSPLCMCATLALHWEDRLATAVERKIEFLCHSTAYAEFSACK